jgi:phosphoacetylglucosamine mutase
MTLISRCVLVTNVVHRFGILHSIYKYILYRISFKNILIDCYYLYSKIMTAVTVPTTTTSTTSDPLPPPTNLPVTTSSSMASSSSSASSSFLHFADDLMDVLSSPKYTYTTDLHRSYYPYGTAGFREIHTELYPICIRVGLAMALLSYLYPTYSSSSSTTGSGSTDDEEEQEEDSALLPQPIILPVEASQQHWGIMITASHNTYEYNGMKCVYVNGNMITEPMEQFITQIVNLRNVETELVPFLQQWIIDPSPTTEIPLYLVGPTPSPPPPPPPKPTIHIGYDTRHHSLEFLQCIVEGIQLLRIHHPSITQPATTTTNVTAACHIHNHQIVTTPILHHIVKHSNAMFSTNYHLAISSYIPLRNYVMGYYDLLLHSYQILLSSTHHHSPPRWLQAPKRLYVDCACGVGYIHLYQCHLKLLQLQAEYSIRSRNHSNAADQYNDDEHHDYTRLQLCNPPVVVSSSSMIAHHHHPTTTAAAAAPSSFLLNEQCGSEFVQKQQAMCTWYTHTYPDADSNYIVRSDSSSRSSSSTNPPDYSYCASMDGDGDRIVFFGTMDVVDNNDDDDDHDVSTTATRPKMKKFVLLDGDHISCLICRFIQKEIQILQSFLLEQHPPSVPGDAAEHPSNSSSSDRTIPASPFRTEITMGVVQTAYANGASTKYLRSQNVPVILAKTGVKYVHAAAHEHFDIGIYFESNGHGTVLFQPNYYQFLSTVEYYMMMHQHTTTTTSTSLSMKDVYCAYQRCKVLPTLINQAVGDAISDLLLIDAILYLQNWSLLDWYTRLYTNLPSRQMKVQVQDRSMIQTNVNETQCIVPSTVQPALDVLMTHYSGGRVFIRPSGTEDVVRIYAEASTQSDADQLATQAKEIVVLYCGGI